MKRFLNNIQLYDGFPPLWYCCSLVCCNPGIPEPERRCYCGFHQRFLKETKAEKSISVIDYHYHFDVEEIMKSLNEGI